MTSIALVGIGYWGQNLLRNLVKVAEVPLCVHSGSPENKNWLKRNYPDIRLTTEYEKALKNNQIDAIVVATPIDTHYEIAKRAIKSEKHVFVEKPIATSQSQAKDLLRLARKQDEIFFVGYIFVHHPALSPLFSRAEDIQVESAYFSWEKMGSFSENILYDLVCHPVSIAQALYGTTPSSTRRLQRIKVTGEVDMISFLLNFSEKRTFCATVNRTAPSDQKSLLVKYSDGSTYFWNGPKLAKFDRESCEYQTIQQTTVEPLLIECQNFVQSIEGRKSIRTGVKFGADVNQTLTRIDE